MFSNDSSLYYLYANQDWSSFASLEYSYAMFYGCPNLRGGAGTKYNEMYVDATYARPDEEGNPGYFTVVAEIYATWDEGNTTLTLRYDGNREANNGVSNWAVYNNVATKVVLDETMKKAEPESTKDWFYSFSLLEEIEHLDYLSTYSVKDMSYMFAGCSSLSVLNVNSFYLSWAESTEGMFSYCLNLKTIWCDHNWHEQLYNKNSKDMFLGQGWLLGLCTGFLLAAHLMFNDFAQMWNGILVFLRMNVIVSHGVIPFFLRSPVHGVTAHVANNVFSVVYPSLFDIAFCQPCPCFSEDSRL